MFETYPWAGSAYEQIRTSHYSAGWMAVHFHQSMKYPQTPRIAHEKWACPGKRGELSQCFTKVKK